MDRTPISSGFNLAVCCAVGFTLLFWWPMLLGEGLIGGDIYTYFMPQKQFLADSLRQGALPLWNPLVGHGYPVLGESQTGALYPLHPLAYGLCDVQTAWNLVHLVHYLAAFLSTWLLARKLGLHSAGALLAATVYVFGWFPPRACLEWAILGGTYLPLCLWCVEGFLQTPAGSSLKARWLIGLSVSLGLQLLGGHYHLAFFTWLTLAVYIPIRAWGELRAVLRPLTCAFVIGVMLGAVQLLPTWELKQRSQRTTVNVEFDPNYGHIPPLFLSQVVAPWLWYDPQLDLDAALARSRWGALRSATNRVEAHLYFGQIPFYLAVIGALIALIRRRFPRQQLVWLTLAGLGVILAIGLFQPTLQHWPGFGFFRGPGRAGIITTLAFGILSGFALDTWCDRWRGRARQALALGAIGLTLLDLLWTPAAIGYTTLVSKPPIAARDQSLVRKLLAKEPQPVRLFAPGPNLPTLLGVSATPVYLGLGPGEYFDPQLALPPGDPPNDFHAFTTERVAWLRAAGVTHILSHEPFEPRGWPVEHLWSGFDQLLNPAWARFQEPIHLYRLTDAHGRITWEPPQTEARVHAVVVRANSVQIDAECPAAARLAWHDLGYPGWFVRVDDGPWQAAESRGLSRSVEFPAGRHRVVWSYHPRSVYWGAALSLLATATLVVIGCWRPTLLTR